MERSEGDGRSTCHIEWIGPTAGAVGAVGVTDGTVTWSTPVGPTVVLTAPEEEGWDNGVSVDGATRLGVSPPIQVAVAPQ